MSNRDDVIDLMNENQAHKDALRLACESKYKAHNVCPHIEHNCKGQKAINCWQEYFLNKAKSKQPPKKKYFSEANIMIDEGTEEGDTGGTITWEKEFEWKITKIEYEK